MNKQITNIVFTKNRPLQLEGYLESLYRHFPKELFQNYVLYKPELFGQQYQQLFQKFPSCNVIEEVDFSSDFLSILNEINTEYILLGVDDVVYFESVDFDLINETFKQFSKDIFGFSLRFSEQSINKSDPVSKANIVSQTVYSINWTQGQTPTTRYPFELCATIYKTELVRKIIINSRKNNTLYENLFAPNSRIVRILSKILRKHKLLKKFGYFYNPNTLESWNCRWCQNNTSQLPSLLYFQKICASAIQVNMVNTSTNNACDDFVGHTVEALNDKYIRGYKCDIGFLEKNKPTDTHSDKSCFKLIKINHN